MKRYLEARGIEMVNTAPYTPQQNVKAERDNRTIIESARTMITAKKLPLSLWAEAVGTAVNVLNRVLATGKENTIRDLVWKNTRCVSFSSVRIGCVHAYRQTILQEIRSKGHKVDLSWISERLYELPFVQSIE